MKLLFATPECPPLARTGGLGDVSAALPSALREIGVDVRVLVPGYREVDSRALAELEVLGRKLRILESRLPSGVPLYLVDCPELYQRGGGPYQDAQGADWPDNALRFGMFSKVAALLASGSSPLDWRPDVLQCHDWPAALAPVFLSLQTNNTTRTLLTIHNLSFQGNFDAAWVERLGLPKELFTLERLEFHGRMSFLKGGIVCADALNTVSPRYAREIQEAEMGCGLEGVLRERARELSGILNGIDTAAWDPARDPFIASRYDARSLERKAANKAALQRRLGLEPDERALLLGSVGRITRQKGSDLIAAAGAELLGGAQLAVLGAGEREIEHALTALAARHPGRVAVRIGFDDELAHLIEAGADVFLMPSRFEPCGLNQMYSQRYGTPPLARETGGLADTIEDGATGFLFQRAEPAALADAVRRAAAAWREPRRWGEMQRAAMARDFSWAAAARRYADLCSRLAGPG